MIPLSEPKFGLTASEIVEVAQRMLDVADLLG